MTDATPTRSRRSLRQNLFELQADETQDMDRLLARLSQLLDTSDDNQLIVACAGRIRSNGNAQRLTEAG